MEYRINKRTGDEFSIIGIGGGNITAESVDEGVATLRMAYENGVNFYDLAGSFGNVFDAHAEALRDVRKNVLYQVHFGADYEKGSYGWTLNLDTVKRNLEKELNTLGTDYIDYGFIHCLDELSDWNTYQKNGVFRFIQELKAQGIVRHIGVSSHTPELANAALDTGMIDLMMFSINPAYDYHHGEYANGSADVRNALYRRCEAEGVGISVMKVFSAGQLLDAKASPFGKALTRNQCIQYALDKPGVLSILPGIRNRTDLLQALDYLSASPEERDYSVLGSFTPQDAAGKCVYCNHCQPCPAGLDVSIINKYYDLARAGDPLAKNHYTKLAKNASDCIGCGHCNRRCPFHVDQVSRMKEIAAYFNK